MSRLTVDFEHLMTVLLVEALPSIKVLPEVDVDYVKKIPILMVSGINGRMLRNGYPGAGWQWALALTLLAEDRDTGGDLSDEVYQAVHRLEGTGADAIGAVSTVEDDSMFSRGPAATVNRKLIVPYNATFTVVVVPF